MRDKTDIRFKEKTQTVGIFGLGYVGLPLSLTRRAGLQVIGFDIDSEKVDTLNAGRSCSTYRAGRHSRSGKRYTFRATTDFFSELIHCDCLVICVPNSPTNSREPDLSFVENTAKAIAPYLRKGQLFCLESTTYPGHHRGDYTTHFRNQRFTCWRRFPLSLFPRAGRPWQ